MAKMRAFRAPLKAPLEIAQKAVIFNSRGKVLLLQNSGYLSKKFWKAWDIPGGRLKDGEDLLDGLKREVLEETGISIENPILVMPDTVKFLDGRKRLFMIYFAEVDDPKIRLSEEHERFSWTDIKDLPDATQFKNMKRWIEKAVAVRKVVKRVIGNAR